MRGQSITAKIKYQRGEIWTFTSYDLLHSLNNYEVQIDNNYITLLESSDNSMIHSIVYNKVEYNFYKFDQQLKDEIFNAWKRLENLNLVQKNRIYLLKELLRVDLKRIIMPEEVILRDGTKLNIKNYVNTSPTSERVDTATSNIL